MYVGKRLRWLMAGVVLLLIPLTAWAAGTERENLSIFDPSGDIAATTADFFYLMLAITGGIFVLVEGVLIYCVFRFRSPVEKDGAEPPQLYGSKPVELAWTVAPVLIVFVLFLVTIRSTNDVRDPRPPKGAMKITVVGHQWWWEYEYPELRSADDRPLRTANEMHMRQDRAAFLELKSADVVHSFWVPRLFGKTDVIPGKTNIMWFNVNQEGLYLGQCAEYCGTQHANMLLRIIADSPEKFDEWAENELRRAVDDPDQRAGKELFLKNSCMNCHTIRGTPAQGTFAPDLTHLMSRQTLASGMVKNDEGNLTAWVQDPQKIKPGCLMPNMQMSEEQVKSIVAYLRTLK
jgi:cytochrome c oxidase subunit II